MKKMKFDKDVWFSAVILVIPLSRLVIGQDCNATATYIKRSFFRPRELGQELLFNSTTAGVTVPCFDSCSNHTLDDCPAFLVDYDASACFRINASSYDQHTLFQLGAVPSGNVNYFQKACLEVPGNCSSRLWVLETSTGYELVGYARKVVNDVSSPVSCGQLCLSETGFDCLSAGYYVNVPGTPNGTCVLSAQDRRTKPDAFRASLFEVVYLENQCQPVTNSCPMNEYQNNSLNTFTEIAIDGISIADCERQCLSATKFTCRAFDFASTGGGGGGGRCHLHGDDSYSLGPGVLTVTQNSVYRERVFCLDLFVSCSTAEMRIALRTQHPFSGRVFAVGFAEECNVDGVGGNETTLVLPLDPGFPRQQCGVEVLRAPGANDRFRTVTALIQIQYNAIIQRRGDRVARVSCNLGDTPGPDITLYKNVSFAVDGSSGVVNITVNSTTVLPNVRLRIVDLSSGSDNANLTVVGKPLQIRIENVAPGGAYDVVPTSLTASNEDGSQSFLLLDGRGCPANTEYFPGFARDSNGTYAADFSAFRFPNSLVVRFKLMVHLCENACAPTNCNNSVSSLRNRRDWSLHSELGYDAATAESDPESIPLEVDLQVLPSKNNEPVILARNYDAVEVAPPRAAIDGDSYFCVPNNTALGVLIGWILLQVIILLACGFLVRYQLDRQDKQLRQSLEEDLLDFDNNRFRGHWSQNVNVVAPQDDDVPTSSRRRDLGGPSSKMESPYL